MIGVANLTNLKQGDIVWIDLNPQSGHEQAGRRPALLISKTDFINKTHLSMVCPISNTNNAFPLHIAMPKNQKVTGFILCEQAKTLDLQARNADFIEHLDINVLEEVISIVQETIDLD